MTSVVRYTDVINSTGAVLTTATGLVVDGKDGGLKVYRRVLAAIDVGTEVGKTRDNTDPTVGCLVVTIKGAKIKGVVGFQAFRPTVATNATFNQALFATAGESFKYGWKMSADGNSLYVLDIGSSAETRLAAGDFIEVALITGNY